MNDMSTKDIERSEVEETFLKFLGLEHFFVLFPNQQENVSHTPLHKPKGCTATVVRLTLIGQSPSETKFEVPMRSPVFDCS